MHCLAETPESLFWLSEERHDQAAQDGVVPNDQNRVVAIHGCFLISASRNSRACCIRSCRGL